MTRLAELWMLKILDTRMGFPPPSLNVVIDYFSHSYLKLCKICLKHTLDATFLGCLALRFCDVVGELLPEWACLTLQGGTTFLLTSKLADISVLSVRTFLSRTILWWEPWQSDRENFSFSAALRLPTRVSDWGKIPHRVIDNSILNQSFLSRMTLWWGP